LPPPSKELRFFVTGGGGVLGRNLLEALGRVPGTVRVLEHRTPLPLKNVERVQGDILDFQDRWIRDVDVVLHLAAQTIPTGDSGAMRRNNTEGTRRLVETLRRAGRTVRLIFTSSIAVFGPCKNGVPVETRSPLEPITAYGRSKRDAEREVARFPGSSVIRFPMLVGPGDRVTGLFQRFARSRLFPVTARRFSAMDMRDAVRLLLYEAQDDRQEQETYTVSDGKSYTWRDVAGIFAQQAGHRVWNVPLPGFLLKPVLFRLAGNADGAHYFKHDWTCRPNFPQGFQLHHSAFERYTA